MTLLENINQKYGTDTAFIISQGTNEKVADATTVFNTAVHNELA